MIGFLIKKSFFDAWDNLLSIVLMNLGFIICLAVMFALPAASAPGSAALAALLVIPGLIITHLYAGAVSVLMYEFSNYQSISIKMIKDGFLKTWKASLVLAVLSSAVVILQSVAMPFYLSMGNAVGIAGAGIIFWIGIFWLLSIQYFFPVLIRMNGGIGKSLKKSFLICLDNPFYSFFVLILSAVIFLISIITAFLMPGISAILLLHQDALKLRLYKYDWLEENIDADVRKIPWPLLLKEDKDNVGHRSLKGMIFPWKD